MPPSRKLLSILETLERYCHSLCHDLGCFYRRSTCSLFRHLGYHPYLHSSRHYLVNQKGGKRGTKEKVTDAVAAAVKEVGDLRFILSRDDWWFVWRFSNGKQDITHDDVPNFKTMNQCAMDLLDPVKLKEFIEKHFKSLMASFCSI